MSTPRRANKVVTDLRKKGETLHEDSFTDGSGSPTRANPDSMKRPRSVTPPGTRGLEMAGPPQLKKSQGYVYAQRGPEREFGFKVPVAKAPEVARLPQQTKSQGYVYAKRGPERDFGFKVPVAKPPTKVPPAGSKTAKPPPQKEDEKSQVINRHLLTWAPREVFTFKPHVAKPHIEALAEQQDADYGSNESADDADGQDFDFNMSDNLPEDLFRGDDGLEDIKRGQRDQAADAASRIWPADASGPISPLPTRPVVTKCTMCGDYKANFDLGPVSARSAVLWRLQKEIVGHITDHKKLKIIKGDKHCAPGRGNKLPDGDFRVHQEHTRLKPCGKMSARSEEGGKAPMAYVNWNYGSCGFKAAS
ncbi:hypothetical protein N0V83_010698 [Neocucurbitaria cava]|uniref:Uncharacterized protein n=1 Tax=Neocucurbitaria cava TaxID=798079 RepID=A0A9W8XXQ2_9PLEO|nr:hypothetical protein N0V83_010698 [Neocucurbitaria cava]